MYTEWYVMHERRPTLSMSVWGPGPWESTLVQKASALKVRPGIEKGADVGPLISPEALKRAKDIIASAEQEVRCSSLCAAFLSCDLVQNPDR